LRPGKKVSKYGIKEKYLWDLYFETWRKSFGIMTSKRNVLGTCILRPGKKL
jgi:hypothetical protein